MNKYIKSLFLALVLSLYTSVLGAQELIAVIKLQSTIGTGSGVVVEETQEGNTCKLTVVTAKHVVEDVTDVRYDYYYGSEIKQHPSLDLAVIQLKASDSCNSNSVTAVPIDYTEYFEGTKIHTSGYPNGEKFIGLGVVGAKLTFLDDFRTIWATARSLHAYVAPGSSGGGVFHNNKLIGIIVGGKGIFEYMGSLRGIYLPIKDIEGLL